MKLYHVSEESGIQAFVPRIPIRTDIDRSKGLVWALNERCLPNFLTPRECPRITYHAHDQTSNEDIARFFSGTSRHCVVIENAWYQRMANTSLYVYEFNTANFRLQDEVAGYYVSQQTETPISVMRYDDLLGELCKRKIEVRIINNLWRLGDAVRQSTLNWSLCDMANAQPRE